MSEKILEINYVSPTSTGDFTDGGYTNLYVYGLNKFIKGLKPLNLNDITDSDIYFDSEENIHNYKPRYYKYYDYITTHKDIEYCCCNTIYIDLLKDNEDIFQYDDGIVGCVLMIKVNFEYYEKSLKYNNSIEYRTDINSYDYNISLLTNKSNKNKTSKVNLYKTDLSWWNYGSHDTYDISGNKITFDNLNNTYKSINGISIIDYINQSEINKIINEKIKNCIKYDKERFEYKECFKTLINVEKISEKNAIDMINALKQH